MEGRLAKIIEEQACRFWYGHCDFDNGSLPNWSICGESNHRLHPRPHSEREREAA